MTCLSGRFLLLISGSREASPVMLEYTVAVVKRAAFRGWGVIVGDAEGVDAQVITTCKSLPLPFHVFGITTQPRNGGPLEPGQYTQIHGSYPDRDRAMCDVADRAIGIWNQRKIRCGTVLTIRAAARLEKPTDLIGFATGKPVRIGKHNWNERVCVP
jgi:hypothetical protein